ncbi:hypothetical protein FRACYDRAFT_232010 [Fragilariopsis cylindrus CCMP1102]|uniref:WD40 repeat-like protein n=1 Tax=Fragilariopsis cylindrus CCMP1102 TaxID=635003 RepID=A0A1E7FUT1_9STRA|nr:hypothetical protein FRACYDRAFT_232010 [Fragilariopsis cylindrus CCMP1102]|eukprot:OEU21865.1 hypothetical protein FRACYDRAFT_232010 [Fragilariopsis cylindrus CCMP1102]
MQKTHEMARTSQNHFLAISLYNEPNMVQIWDIHNTDQGPTATLTIPGEAGVKCMKFSQDGSLVAIGSAWSVGLDSGIVSLYGPAGLLREEYNDPFAEMPPRGVDCVLDSRFGTFKPAILLTISPRW